MVSPTLQSKYTALQKAFDSSKNDPKGLPAVGKLLTGLKLDLAKSSLLVPSSTSNEQDLLIARSTLELGAFYSLRSRDVPAFERYVQLLEGGFYRDLSSTLPTSTSRPPLIGLHLLSYLSAGKISEFHILLESLASENDSSKILEDEFVSWPVDLERWLMEGSYTKVWRARERVPREEYKVLLEGLVGTIRNEVAQCHERAYGSLPLSDATRLLFFETGSETVAFAQGRGWQFSPTTKIFTFPSTTSLTTSSLITPDAGVLSGSASGMGREGLIKSALGYANELEAIV